MIGRLAHWWTERRKPMWYVVRGGRLVAALTDPRLYDWPWYSWEIVPLTDDPDEAARMTTTEFWPDEELSRTRFLSRWLGRRSPGLWAGLVDGRLMMRGLH